MKMTLIQIFSFTIILIIVISFPPCLCTEREKSEDLWSTDVNLMWKWIDSQMEKGKLRNSTRNRCKVDTIANAMRPLKSKLGKLNLLQYYICFCNVQIFSVSTNYTFEREQGRAQDSQSHYHGKHENTFEYFPLISLSLRIRK